MTASVSRKVRSIDEPLLGQRGQMIFPHEMEEDFIASSGPGGQNVNKVASAVQLRFAVPHAAKLDERTRARLLDLAGRRATKDGVIVIEAREERRQEANRVAARQRLLDLLIDASAPPPKKRRKTRPSRGAIERRLKAKSERGEVKAKRQKPSTE